MANDRARSSAGIFGRKGAWAALAAASGLGLLVAPAPALATSAGLKPSEAPLVTVGQHYFGNTGHEDVWSGRVDLWHLPPLLTGDAITIAWDAPDQDEGPYLCLAQNIDDYDWAESNNQCNGSKQYQTASNGSARSVIEAKNSTATPYLEFLSGCCESSQPYDFTIESIQHAVGVGLTPVTSITPTSTLTGTANLSSGAPVPDGLVFTLTASWVTPANKAAHSRSYTASSIGGGLTFPLNLPATAEGKHVSVTISRPADPQYLGASSAAVEIPVARVTPRIHHHRHRRHRHHRHRHHRRASATSSATPEVTAQASDLEQECKQALLTLPTVLNKVGEHRTEMFNPGGYHQFVVVALRIAVTPSSCSNFEGFGRATVEMRSHDNPKQTIYLGDFPFSSGPGGNETGGVLSQSASSTADNFACGKGKRTNRVWLQFVSKVKNLSTSHIIGTKRARKNIEIEGHGYGC